MQKMTEKEAIEALKLEGGLEISGKAIRVTKFFEGLIVAQDALEKHIPKKPHKFIAYDGIERNGCPHCFEEYGKNEILYAGQKYCSVCSQRIDWEE